ncbi:hypothetical protein A5651_06775 [Mycobacterium sp. 1274761.0]|nr:hypothetical protein A5651_06775 [Mycobacterium sp. 1274761.0]
MMLTPTTVALPNPVTLIGVNRSGVSITGTSDVPIPAHQAGDDIYIIAAQWPTNTVPPKPAAGGTVPAWEDVDAPAGSNNVAARTAHFKATANNHTSGDWSGASFVGAVVVRGADATTPTGGHAMQGGASTNGDSIAPAVTLARSNGTSLLLHLCVSPQSTTWDAAPAGYTKRAEGIGLCVGTKNSSTADGSVTFSGNAGAEYRAATIEVRAH